MSDPFTPTAGPANDAGAANDAGGDGALQAVLWDMDGTIVNTDPYWIQAEQELVLAHGGTWTESQATAMVGQALPVAAGLLQDAGVQLTVREIIDHLIAEVTAKSNGALPWRPGARELLAELRGRRIPCALVTMSERPLADAVCKQLPAGTFDCVITGDMVTHGKPHPEAYLQAFARIGAAVPGLSPDRVVAIEDSLPGVTSAEAAGVVTIAVPHLAPLPPARSRTEWSTLAGRTIADLEAVVATRARQIRAAADELAAEGAMP